MKLTQTVAEALAPRAQAYVVYDAPPGFGCRITPRGARAWVFEYRVGGGRGSATRRMTLGRIEALPYNKARRAAEALYHRTRLGEDPAGARDEQRGAITIASLVERYMTEEAPTLKPKTARLYAGYFRNHIVPALGNKRARNVTFTDIAKMHRAIGADTPVAANRTVALMSSLYTWAGKAGEVPRGTNPAADVSRFKEQARTRYLSDDEITRLGETLALAETEGLPYTISSASADRIKKIRALIDDPRGDAAVRAVARETLAKLKAGKRNKHAPGPNARHLVSPHATGAIRLLLLSGCRLSEILTLRWADVDVARGLLMLPDSKTGARPVWLNAAALAVLETLSTIRRGDYVIAGEQPDQPRADLNKPWRQIVKHARLDGVTLHPLRHTHASIGVGAGIGLPLVGALLGHRNVKTTQRYAHIANDPARRAAETIGTTIAAALERRSPESA
jgi:integrase